MTLVAAFSVNGVPTLIGDFLVTDEHPHANHIFLPTKPELQNVKPEPGERRVCGLRKKIHKIGDRLVVGFTGDLRAGQQLLKALYGYAEASSPKLLELERFLATASVEDKDKTELVGWIWEKRPICFHWRGTEPDKVKVVHSVFSGSGAEHFRNEIMAATESAMSQDIKVAVEKAIYFCVAKTGKVLLTELMAARNLSHHYGFGAEAILWDGAKFFYIDKVAYAFWNIQVNKDNSLLIHPSNVSAIYKNYDQFSVIQVSHLGPKTGFFQGIEAKNTYAQIITPLNDDMPNFDVQGVGRQSYDSPLWFSGIVVVNPANSKHTECIMVSECAEGKESFISFKHGVLYLDVAQLHARLPRDIFN